LDIPNIISLSILFSFTAVKGDAAVKKNSLPVDAPVEMKSSPRKMRNRRNVLMMMALAFDQLVGDYNPSVAGIFSGAKISAVRMLPVLQSI